MIKVIPTNAVISIIISMTLYSCTEFIDVDLGKNDTSIFIVDASLETKANNPNQIEKAYVTLTLTQDFFENANPSKYYIDDAQIYIEEGKAKRYNFTYDDVGRYIPNEKEQFTEIKDDTPYVLHIEYKGKTYKTTPQKLIKTPPIRVEIEKIKSLPFSSQKENPSDFVYQTNQYLKDNKGEDNYYISHFKVTGADKKLSQTRYIEDKFQQGNEIRIQNINPYTVFKTTEITSFSTDKHYFSYMKILQNLSIGQGASGAPFSVEPIIIRGNIYNPNDNNDKPLGYFRIINKRFASIPLQTYKEFTESKDKKTIDF